MFFSSCVEEVAPIYQYQLDYLSQGLSELKPTSRAFASKTNSVYSKHSSAATSYVSAYIASQQHPMLLNYVPRRHHVIEQASEPDRTVFYNMTYFDRVSHLVIVPLTGSVSYQWSEGPKRVAHLEPGKAYIVNNRAPRAVTAMELPYRCYVALWLDFDLMFYLKEYDGNGQIERKKDEYYSDN